MLTTETHTCVLKRSASGFTLLELLAALVIAAILAFYAVPNLRSYVANSRITTHTNNLVGALNLARSEAISRGESVSVCPSSNGVFCTESSWDAGWIVFVDNDVDGIIDGTDEILIGGPGVEESGLVINGPNYIQFQPNGGLRTSCAIPCFGEDATPVAMQIETPLWVRIAWHILPITEAVAAPPEDQGQGGQGQGGQGQGGQGQGQGGPGQGASTDPGPPPDTANFAVCDGHFGRSISVSTVGHITVTDSACQ